jgi:Trk K+ transport system NAD-binding subunit
MYALQPRPRIVVVRLPDGRADFPQRIAELDGVETVIGDARELSVLNAAGLDSAFSVAALTSDDLLNLQISLAARRVRPDIQIVVRVFSDVLAERLADIFGIRAAYSTSSLASPTLTAAALIGGVEHGFALGNRLFVTEQFDVTARNDLDGVSVDQVRAKFGLLVVELRRAGILQLLPAAAEVLCAEDRVILLGSIEAVARMR